MIVLCLIGSDHSCPEGGLECVDRDGVPCHPSLKADPAESPCNISQTLAASLVGLAPRGRGDCFVRPWPGPKT